jgi:predicted nucleic acid-binding protein
VIVVDTGIWIDHFHGSEQGLEALLDQRKVGIHPLIVGELAMGSLRDRRDTLRTLLRLPSLVEVDFADFLATLDRYKLYSRGLSFVDASVLASLLASPGTSLWTRDKRFKVAAIEMAIPTLDG